ncbi:prostatic acid phosphatase-like [Rhynchophorus ferrugineus]|uniref:acid phosphatase n=1 Tax=Rhynchophorus ferrugineus TaxID=354439 RepID=A0A834INA0_RHYFE|nr:hypothetical protein GWI33_023291 [Rhynchophorus ferrugineus]
MNLFCSIEIAILFGFFTFCSALNDTLDAVVVVFRHGDRTPVRPYNNDPYKNKSYWPADWGMLTNTGKQQHFKLGQYFRQRYSNFLPQEYSGKDIFVRSTNVDRTLMSAESNLAGLYPPVSKDIWNNNILWQPIPIHTIPENMDAVLAAKKPCKKYDYLYERLLKSDFIRNINHMNHDLYAYLTRYSGDSIQDLTHLEYLYNTLSIEALYNYTLPDWAQKVYPKKMLFSVGLSFTLATYTPDLARFKIGPFFNELVNYFINRTKTNQESEYYAPKFLMFSAHDTTIANLLNAMGAFEPHSPPYTSTIIFELHKSAEQAYVNVFYKNTTEARPITIRACTFNCNFDKFLEILKPITVSLDMWESECNSLWLLNNYWNVYLLLVILFVAVICIITLSLLIKSRAKRSEVNLYTQLPNEEYA